ncbi:hypothetical protein SDC9_187618 [bioreactor metagenome]|uniref:Uncharacterized protein n=1 Tax=bioreactor metagenome TaxID=1076179 RepID=A0A645HXN7_9ZZZZ
MEKPAFPLFFVTDFVAGLPVVGFNRGRLTAAVTDKRIVLTVPGHQRGIVIRVGKIDVYADYGVVVFRLTHEPQHTVCCRGVFLALQCRIDLMKRRVTVIVPVVLPADEIQDFGRAESQRIGLAHKVERARKVTEHLAAAAAVGFGHEQFHHHGFAVIILLHANPPLIYKYRINYRAGARKMQ